MSLVFDLIKNTLYLGVMDAATALKLQETTEQVKRLAADVTKIIITNHVRDDNPERQIKKDDIVAALRTGVAVRFDPRVVDGKVQFGGPSDRWEWYGIDQKERQLILKLVVKENVVVVHASLYE